MSLKCLTFIIIIVNVTQMVKYVINLDFNFDILLV